MVWYAHLLKNFPQFVVMQMRACVLSQFSRVRLFVTLWSVAQQAPLSKGLSRQEYWSGLPFPPSGDLPDPGFKPMSPVIPALAGSFTIVPPGKPSLISTLVYFLCLEGST